MFSKQTRLVADGGESKASAMGKGRSTPSTELQDIWNTISQKTRQTTAVFCLGFISYIPLAVLEQQAQNGIQVQPHHVMVSMVKAWGTCGLQSGATVKKTPDAYTKSLQVRLKKYLMLI